MTSADGARPTVSVALCTHNGERFITAQLRSILGQSYPPREIIISDDASTDSTLAVVDQVVADFRRRAPDSDIVVTVVKNQPALGVVENFSQAIELCTSELIVLSDQDDVWVPGRLELIAGAFARRPALTLLHSNARLIDGEGLPLGTTLFEALQVSSSELHAIRIGKAADVFVRRNLVTGATAAFRAELRDRALPVPPGWIHDEWLGIIAASTGEVDVDTRLLVDYRQHDNNQIGAAKPTLRDKIRKLREPRTERNRNLFVRASELVARFEGMSEPVGSHYVRLAWGKQAHERYRVALPVNRFLRVIPVLARAAGRQYSRYGLGAQDVLRDLVQPVD